MADKTVPADPNPGPSVTIPQKIVMPPTNDPALVAPANGDYVSDVVDHRPDVYSAPAEPPAVPDVAGRDIDADLPVEVRTLFVPVYRFNGSSGNAEWGVFDSYEAAQAQVELDLKSDPSIGSAQIEKRFVRA